jgi:hypothetical protein
LAFTGGSQDFIFTGPEMTTQQIHALNFDLIPSGGTGEGLAGSVTVIANYPSAGQCAFKASAISG